jgi:hypothetical protein
MAVPLPDLGNEANDLWHSQTVPLGAGFGFARGWPWLAPVAVPTVLVRRSAGIFTPGCSVHAPFRAAGSRVQIGPATASPTRVWASTTPRRRSCCRPAWLQPRGRAGALPRTRQRACVAGQYRWPAGRQGQNTKGLRRAASRRGRAVDTDPAEAGRCICRAPQDPGPAQPCRRRSHVHPARDRGLARGGRSDVAEDTITTFDGKGRPGQGPRRHQVPLLRATRADLAALKCEGELVVSTTAGKEAISVRTLSGWAHVMVSH